MNSLPARSLKKKTMGWTESESVCNKHPTHYHNQGVCPSCLRERLSHLCASSRRESSVVVVPSFSSSPFYSSSSTGSPPAAYFSSKGAGRHNRNPSEMTMGTVSSLMKSDGTGLKKSRSIAFVNSRSVVGENGKKGRTQSKKGFWSSLLRLKGKEKGVVMHSSMTLRERLA